MKGFWPIGNWRISPRCQSDLRVLKEIAILKSKRNWFNVSIGPSGIERFFVQAGYGVVAGECQSDLRVLKDLEVVF